MDRTDRDDTNVVPLALARLERMIQLRLGDSAPFGKDPAITVKLVDSGIVSPNIPDDPAFYDLVVDRIVETLDGYLDEVDAEKLPSDMVNPFAGPFDEPSQPTDSFIGRLRCMACGIVTVDDTSACETYLRGGTRGKVFSIGSRLDIVHEEVALDYYARAVRPQCGAPVHVIEGWECPHCQGVNWAEIVIRDSLVSSVWSVALSTSTLERAHYVTSECVELAARLSGRPSWALLRDDVFDLLMDELEAH